MGGESGAETLSPAAGQEAKADAGGITPEEYMGQVVLALIEHNGGKTSTRQVVYAMTMERRVDKGMFQDISDELTRMRASGLIKSDDNGKYSAVGTSEPGKNQHDSSPRPKRGKRPERQKRSGKEKEALDAKMQEALGEPVAPRQRRKRPQISQKTHQNHRKKRR